MPNRVPRTAVSRLALIAVDVLIEAHSRSGNGPIERTATLKLALGYLLLSGLATKHHVKTIWEILGHEGVFNQPSCRETHFGSMIYWIKDQAEKLK